jgi:hypothetical protein
MPATWPLEATLSIARGAVKPNTTTMSRLEEIGDLALKGLMQAVAVYNVAAE